jgi:hypothetical protein
MTLRKTKENEFFVHHLETFKTLGISNPFFVIKTAFFQKGKYGRYLQLFEWELKKNEDIYIEFYDNVNDDKGNLINMIPFHNDRILCKYKYNPYYAQEYEQKENFNQSNGEQYFTYTLPLSELITISKNGEEVIYSLYEKNKDKNTSDNKIPRLQKSLVFPDFENEYDNSSNKVSELFIEDVLVSDDDLISNMTITDFAAIMWKKPVSNKVWLNSLINKQ